MMRAALRLLSAVRQALRDPFYAAATDDPDWVPPVIDGMPVPIHIRNGSSGPTFLLNP